MHARYIFTATLALLTIPHTTAAFANDEEPVDSPEEEGIITDRPDVAESSRTVGKYRTQLEIGVDVDSNDTTALAIPTKLRFGLTDSFEVHVESDLIDATFGDDGSTGLSTFDVGGKYHISESEGLPSLGLLLALELPTAEGAESLILHPTFAADFDLGASFGLGTNLGLSVPLTEQAGQDPSLRYAASLGYGIGDLGLYAELSGERAFGDAFGLVFDGGFAYGLSPTMQLDGYVRAGIKDAPGVGGGLGFSIKI